MFTVALAQKVTADSISVKVAFMAAALVQKPWCAENPWQLMLFLNIITSLIFFKGLRRAYERRLEMLKL